MSIETPAEASTDAQHDDTTTPHTLPEYATEATDPDYPRTDTDPAFDGTDDPLPHRGISDITFGDLDDDHTNPATLYDRVILHNGYTCGNCFARVGRQWELPNEKTVEDLAALTSYIHREIPYQLPKDERDEFDYRYYQSETFPGRAGFIPAMAPYRTTKRILICYECGHQLTQSGRPTAYGIYRGVTMPKGMTYTPANAWRYDANSGNGNGNGNGTGNNTENESGDGTRTRDAPRTKAEAVYAAHRLSDTLSEYGISHNEHVLTEIVRGQKSISNTTMDDDAIFRRAVTAAVRSVDEFSIRIATR